MKKEAHATDATHTGTGNIVAVRKVSTAPKIPMLMLYASSFLITLPFECLFSASTYFLSLLYGLDRFRTLGPAGPELTS